MNENQIIKLIYISEFYNKYAFYLNKNFLKIDIFNEFFDSKNKLNSKIQLNDFINEILYNNAHNDYLNINISYHRLVCFFTSLVFENIVNVFDFTVDQQNQNYYDFFNEKIGFKRKTFNLTSHLNMYNFMDYFAMSLIILSSSKGKKFSDIYIQSDGNSLQNYTNIDSKFRFKFSEFLKFTFYII